jgi:recombination protein RecA
LEVDTKVIDLLKKQIEKEYGKGSFIKVGDAEIQPIESISTGSMGLDLALGVGGVPKGRIVEIFGPESSGKTTLALQIISEAQRAGGRALFVDAEHAIDLNYAKKLGVDTDELFMSQPDHGEQALDIVEKSVESGAFSVIVIDSVANLTPKAEIDGDMIDQNIGLQARLMSHALRKLTALINKTSTTVLFINQIRANIGVHGYGPKETTTGGKALKFYASVRIDIRRISTNKVAEVSVSNRVRARVVKNKVGPPFREALFDIEFGKGISKLSEIIDYGVQFDIIDKSGAWFSYEDKKLGQGKEKAKETLLSDESLMNEIELKIKEKLQPELFALEPGEGE